MISFSVDICFYTSKCPFKSPFLQAHTLAIAGQILSSFYAICCPIPMFAYTLKKSIYMATINSFQIQAAHNPYFYTSECGHWWGGGVLTCWDIRGCDTFWVSFFMQKSLTMGLIFSFWTLENFENLKCFCCKITENGYFFWKNSYTWVPIYEKITPEHGYGSQSAGSTSPTNPKVPKHGYLFMKKLPLNMGMGPKLSVAHPRPIQIWGPSLPPPNH